MSKANIFSQSFHDCTTSEDFNEFSSKATDVESMIEKMELELSRSLSKFDKCINQDYLDIQNNHEIKNKKNLKETQGKKEVTVESKMQENNSKKNDLANNMEQESKSTKEEVANNMEQESKSTKEEAANNMEQESKSTKEEAANNMEQESKSTKEEAANNMEQESKSTKEEAAKDYEVPKISANIKLQSSSENQNVKSKTIIKSIANTDLSGTEYNEENINDLSEIENNINFNEEEFQDNKEVASENINGKIPDDIPQNDNDSILEEQIRLAAINEKDPKKKKRLWNEYRKYKGLPQKD